MVFVAESGGKSPALGLISRHAPGAQIALLLQQTLLAGLPALQPALRSLQPAQLATLRAGQPVLFGLLLQLLQPPLVAQGPALPLFDASFRAFEPAQFTPLAAAEATAPGLFPQLL